MVDKVNLPQHGLLSTLRKSDKKKKVSVQKKLLNYCCWLSDQMDVARAYGIVLHPLENGTAGEHGTDDDAEQDVETIIFQGNKKFPSSKFNYLTNNNY